MSHLNEPPDNLLIIDLEKIKDKGQDANLCFSYLDSFVLAVFDGLGGRSGMMEKEHGARVASQSARKSTFTFFKNLERKGKKLDQTNVFDLQRFIQQDLRILKNDYERKSDKPTSRIKGSLKSPKDRLTTTLALATLYQSQNNSHTLNLDVAWIGDSRVYFLSYQKGLQQLTTDDVKEYKDDYDSVLKSGSPMTQYLTADMGADAGINFNQFFINEPGLIITCTDGAFDGLYPWEFEHVLLYYLSNSNNIQIYQEKLNYFFTNRNRDNYGNQNLGDDITLLLFSFGFGSSFGSIKNIYRQRFEKVSEYWDIEKTKENLEKIWNEYRGNYEEKINQISSLKSTNVINPSVNEGVTQQLSNIQLFDDQKLSLINEQQGFKGKDLDPLCSSNRSLDQTPTNQGVKSIRGSLDPLIDTKNLPQVLEFQKSSSSQEDSLSSPEFQDPSVDPKQDALGQLKHIRTEKDQENPAHLSRIKKNRSNGDFPETKKHLSLLKTDYIEIAQTWFDEDQNYSKIIRDLEKILKQEDYKNNISILSFLGLGFFKYAYDGRVEIPIFIKDLSKNSSYQKSKKYFSDALELISENNFLKTTDYILTLKVFVKCLSQINIIPSFFNNKELNLIETIINEISSDDEKDPFVLELFGKIYILQEKNEDSKKKFKEAQDMYKQIGNKERAFECTKYLTPITYSMLKPHKIRDWFRPRQ